MSRAALLLILFPVSAFAQPQPLRPLAGGFGGVSPEQFGRSNLAIAAGQLAAELGAVRAELAVAPTTPALRANVLRLADRAVRQAQDLQRLARTGANRDQLVAADQAVDQTADALFDTVSRGIALTPGLADAISRARYADQQVHAALAGNPGGGNDLRRVARLAAAVEEQADDLRDRLREDGADRGLERGVRTFSGRIDRVRIAAEDGNLQQAQTDYALASDQWGRLAGPLAAFGSRNPAVRQQTARVDSLFRSLGERLNINPGPLPPGPGPLPPGFLGRGLLAVAAGETGGPRVRLFADNTGQSATDFFAYDPDFRGGVRIAVADLTGDNVPDLVTAPGGGMQPLVRVFDGRTLRLVSEFLAYDATWTGGVFVAAADRTPDGRALVVTGADVGAGPHVKVFDVAAGREIDSWHAFDERNRCGVRVALGDVDGDGRPDVVTAAGPNHEPRVRVFSGNGRALIGDFLAFDRNWTGGIQVSVGDISKNGRCEVIVGSDVGGPNRVRVFDPRRGRVIGELAPFPPAFRGGIRVACLDYDNDGWADIVCAGGPDDRTFGQPVRIFSGRDRRPISELRPFEPTFRGGAFVDGR